MQDKIISEAIYTELMESNLKYYVASLSEPKNADRSNDLYSDMRELLSQLTTEQRSVVFSFFRNIIVDTASTILGTIDGTTFPVNADGDYILKYNNKEIQGCLQDYFLAKAEDDK